MTHTSAPERLHALDAVRAFALLLGLVLHAAMSFIPGAPIWIVQDNAAADPAGLLFYIPHIFRMTLFFFIAGFFGRMMFHRKGALGFGWDRMKRVFLPLTAFWMPVFAGVVAALIWAAVKANGGEMPEGGEEPPLTAETFPLTHLWFLYVLSIFYLGALITRLPLKLLDGSGALRNGLDRVIALLARFHILPLLLAAPIAIWFVTAESWYAWFGIPTPDTGLVPNNGALIGYGLAFSFGWVAHRQIDLLTIWRKAWPIYGAVALALTAYCVNYAGLSPNFMPMEMDAARIAYAAAYALASWLWSFALIGAAMTFLSGHSPVTRYLADGSYWIYIAHLPVMMALQVWVSDMDMAMPVKLALVIGTTFTICLVSYELLVRHTPLGSWLNGKRYPWRKATAAQPTAANSPAE